MPAIYDLANRGLLPPGFSLVGFARRDWADQDFAQVVHDSVKALRPHRVPRGGLEAARRGLPVRPRRLRRRRRLRPAPPDDRGARRGPRHRTATTRSTWPSRPASSAPSSASSRSTGSPTAADGLLAPGRRREALRPRPRVGAGAQRHPGGRLRLGLDLPDRPLPRQGDGPEHPGDALRQHDVRADLERQLRRPRADHHGRGRRHRRPRRLLRRHRRRARRDPEPPAPADVAGRDGGADVVRRREPADREAEGALERRAPPPARPDDRPRRSTPRAGPAARRSPGFLEEEGIKKSSTTETYAAVTLNVETRRWAGVPFYLRTGKRLGRRVTEVAIVFKKAPHQPFSASVDRGPHPERPGDPDPARRGHDAAVRLEGARHRDGDPRRQHGLRVRRVLHRVLARRPTSG